MLGDESLSGDRCRWYEDKMSPGGRRPGSGSRRHRQRQADAGRRSRGFGPAASDAGRGLASPQASVSTRSLKPASASPDSPSKPSASGPSARSATQSAAICCLPATKRSPSTAPFAEAREFSSSPAQAPTFWDAPPTERCISAGGWGPALGDEGSGFWIGQEALRAGFWAKDRGVATTLLTEIGRALGRKVSRRDRRDGQRTSRPRLPCARPYRRALRGGRRRTGDSQFSNAPASSWPNRSPSSR